MTRFTTFAVAAATLLSAAAPAFAGDMAQNSAANARINVAVCERDALTQAAYRQNYGAHPTFVTADQVLSARVSGERWSEPRCMTASEHRRLTQAMAPRQTRTAGTARPVL